MIVYKINHLDSTSRSKLTMQQLKFLNDYYITVPHPTNQERTKLSAILGIHPNKIKNWFQNRRAKDKRIFNHIVPVDDYKINSEELPQVYPACNDLYRRKN